ncbi:MAG: major facilitator transporter [Acidobacteria bacterium]|nr:major facilitator transporter [Acidobacteriota bacterium]
MNTPAREVGRTMILPVMCLCVVLIIATVAAINVSIPQIETSSLHPSNTQLIWIVDVYVIVFASLLFPAGAIGDRYGRKRALLAGLGAYVAGSVLAALAHSTAVLLCARVVMGAGAAFIMPTTLAIISGTFDGAERVRAIAVWAAFTAIGGGIGLVVGGAIVTYLTWQHLFWIGASIGLLTLALAAKYTPVTARQTGPMDMIGAALLVVCFGAALSGIIEAPKTGWGSGGNLTAFAISAAAVASFTWYELRRVEPLLDPRSFGVPTLRSGALGLTTSFFAMFSLYFVNAQFLQYAKGFDPLVTGLAILPATVSLYVSSLSSARLAERVGTKTVLIAGMLFIAFGLWLISLCGPTTPYRWYALALAIVAVGPGLSNPSMSASIMGSLPPDKAGVGSAINDTSRELGSALGIAVMGTILTNQFPRGLPPEVSQALGTDAARLSVAEVIRRVHTLSPAIQDSRLYFVRRAFADAVHTGFRVSAVVVLVVTAIMFWWYPGAAGSRRRSVGSKRPPIRKDQWQRSG